MIAQAGVRLVDVQEVVILVILKNSIGVGIGIVMVVQQDVQHVQGLILINVKVVLLVIIFREEIHVLHVQQDVQHVQAHQHAKLAKAAIICQEPHAQHVIQIV